MSNEEVPKTKIKLLLIEHLKRNPNTQVENIMRNIESGLDRKISKDDEQYILELLHEFTTSNVIMPAMNRYNAGWPWFSVTEHGKNILDKSGVAVYDYEGYLSELKSRIPKLDPIIEQYISEGLSCYQTNLFYSSMVMLACSSERAIHLLIEAYLNSIKNESNRNRLLSRLSKKDISSKYAEFKKSFDSTKNQINPDKVAHEFDLHIDSIFNFIRILRNSIVHPNIIPNITSAIAYSNLQQFSYYVETIYKLIHFYTKNETIL